LANRFHRALAFSRFLSQLAGFPQFGAALCLQARELLRDKVSSENADPFVQRSAQRIALTRRHPASRPLGHTIHHDPLNLD
jgi:hypothetical protein